jgi:hypothetical protein
MCRYDQLILSQTLKVSDTVSPESWNNQIDNPSYSVVGYQTAWKLPWQERAVEWRDEITLLENRITLR